jgi:hypothetical protein
MYPIREEVGVPATPSSNEVMASVQLHYTFPKVEINQYL